MEETPPVGATRGSRPLSMILHPTAGAPPTTPAGYAAPLQALVLGILPLAFLALFFLWPLLSLTHAALHNPILVRGLPGFVEALRQDPSTVPGEETFRVLARELAPRVVDETYRQVLRPFSEQDPELWRIIERTVRAFPPIGHDSTKAWFLAANPAWGEEATWMTIRRVSAPYTLHHLVNALDVRLTPMGSFRMKVAERRQYAGLILQTMAQAALVTLFTLVLAYPTAYVIAGTRRRWRLPLLGLVLAPFLCAVLVETYAWMVLFQRQGPINELLLGLRLIAEPMSFLPSRGALYATLTYVLLPLMILPIHRAMRGIGRDRLQTAASLGADPLRAFTTAYLPATVPGILAGCVLVFVCGLGYFVTPALLAGAADRPVSVHIVELVTRIAAPGAAAAFGTLLLLVSGVGVYLVLRVVDLAALGLYRES